MGIVDFIKRLFAGKQDAAQEAEASARMAAEDKSLAQNKSMSDKDPLKESVTWMIAGLGNPEKKYLETRHNVGFKVVDAMTELFGIKVEREAYTGLVGTGEIAGQKVAVVKPLTYMNLSGECLKPMMDHYSLDPAHVLVIYDDISLEPGNLRIRKKGSAGGHNGIKSIIACLESQDFPRIKVGVGVPGEEGLIAHVLGNFEGEDVDIMKESFQRAAKAAEAILLVGADAAMNEYNQKKK